MKKILLILLMFISFGAYAQTVAPTDREILLDISKQQTKQGEQIVELTKQTTENNKQIAIVATRLEGFEKSVDKRFDMLFYTMLALLAGIFGFIGYVFWDRKTALKPIETSNAELVIAIALLKEKEAQLEAKLQEKQLKDEKIFKNLFEKFPDLANLA